MADSFDPETGEVIEGTATAIPPGHIRAASGEVMQTTAHTAGEFLDMIADGQFSHEVDAKLREVAAAMNHISNATGQKTKGKVVVTFDLSKEGEAFQIQGKVKATAPELPQPKSIMWTDEATGGFSRFPPNQTQMFGRRVPLRNV